MSDVWSSKRILITGAGGFIGSHLTEALAPQAAHVRAFVHYNGAGTWGWLDGSAISDHIEVITGDVTDPETISAAAQGVDVIFHLAALIGIPYSYRAVRSYVRTNVEGTLNVLQAAKTHEVQRVIHTSTSEVYGTALQVPISEDHPLQGQSPYSASKIGADKMAEAFSLSFETPVLTVRPFNTYGPRQSSRAIIPSLIGQFLTRDKIKVGNLDPTRDFNFVDDTVDGFIKAAEADVSGMVVNLGSGQETSIRDLVTIIAEVVGKQLDIEEESERVRPAGSEVMRLCADNTRAREMLGWSPSVDLREGIERTVRWMKEHIDEYRTGAYAV